MNLAASRFCAGAIAAALIAALNARGQALSDLENILDSVDYPKFMSGSRLHAAANLLRQRAQCG